MFDMGSLNSKFDDILLYIVSVVATPFFQP